MDVIKPLSRFYFIIINKFHEYIERKSGVYPPDNSRTDIKGPIFIVIQKQDYGLRMWSNEGVGEL